MTFQLEGMPLFPTGLSTINDAMFRLDDTISQVQLLQGGPSVLYGNGQPGVISNFLLRQGTATPHGDVGLTFMSQGGQRVDGFYGFPIGHDSGWFGSIGGFYEKSDGVRNPQFPADKGGQLTATLSHDFKHGSILLYGRYMNVRSQFVTDVPLLNPSVGRFSSFPGFDALTGTFESQANRHQVWQVQPCTSAGCVPGIMDINMDDGRGAVLRNLGGQFHYDFGGGWSLSDSFIGISGYFPDVAYFSGPQNPLPLSEFIQNQSAVFGVPPGMSATATYATGGSVPMNTQVIPELPQSDAIHARTLADQFRLSKAFADGNTLTFGGWFATTSQRENIYFGYSQLLPVVTNPSGIQVNLNGGGRTYELTNSQGLFENDPPVGFVRGWRWHQLNTALFLTDQWHIGRWHLTAGMREDRVSVAGVVQNAAAGIDLDDNPYTLWNNKSVVLLDSASNTQKFVRHKPSWTAGVAYQINSHTAVYARANHGISLPNFSDFVFQGSGVPVETVNNMEVGVKYGTPKIFLDVSAYRRLFYGIPYSANLPSGMINLLYGSSTKGLDVQAKIKPFTNFSVALVADWMDGHYTHNLSCTPFVAQDGSQQCVGINGKMLARQPRVQYHITPMYRIPTRWGSLRLWVTYDRFGPRFNGQANLQPLGSYSDLRIGATADVGKHWQFQLRGTNVTDVIGLTEGNASLFGAANTNGVIQGRSIQGREVNFQAKYRF